jgi:excisionase family DNA binding protein
MSIADHARPFLTVAEVAGVLGCSEKTVRRRIQTGELTATRLGDSRNSALRVPAGALTAWLWAEPGGDMPRASSRKPDPDATYVAWTGGAAEGPEYTLSWSKGVRLRGDSVEVQAAPWCFVAEGTPRAEWPDVRAHPDEQAARLKRIEDNRFDVRSRTRPEVFGDALVRVVKPLTLGYGRNVQGIPEHIETLEKGAILRRSEPIVAVKPDHFADLKL